MKAAIILGTRPEIVKMSPIIREFERLSSDYFIIHTGQHYSHNMDRMFFEQLKIPKPRYSLKVGSGSHAEETGKMLIGIEGLLVQEKPDIVLVEGDTNSVLSGALVASKLHIKIGHVEAGLRSYDRSMPEEVNRVLTDHVSDYLFAPTEQAKKNLLKEGIEEDNIFLTGNTIVDAMMQNIEMAKNFRIPLIANEREEYFLATLHRQENVDVKEHLGKIMIGLEETAERFKVPIICPLHPRTKKMIIQFDLKVNDSLKFTEPLDYLTFLNTLSNARLVFTDSGGVQEEACILRVPCVTLRYNTERPETIDVGANVLAGTEPKNMLERAEIMLNRNRDWINPFGDGKAAERIVRIITSSS